MSQILEAEVQLTDERKRLSEVQILLKLGIDSAVSKRAETTLALRGTEMAFMWLGKAKGALGIKNPYPHSADPKSRVIEPPVDTVQELSAEVKEVISGPKKELEVVLVKQGRKLLEGLCRAIANDLQIMTDHRQYQLCIENAYTHAEEAKMRLGQVLGIIRDENPGQFPTGSDVQAGEPGTQSGKVDKPVKDKKIKEPKAPKEPKTPKEPKAPKVKEPKTPKQPKAPKAKKGETAPPVSGEPSKSTDNAGDNPNQGK